MFDRDTIDTFKLIMEKYPDRILDVYDSFSSNQYASKDWLIEKLNEYPHHFKCKTLDKKFGISILLLLSKYFKTLVFNTYIPAFIFSYFDGFVAKDLNFFPFVSTTSKGFDIS